MTEPTAHSGNLTYTSPAHGALPKHAPAGATGLVVGQREVLGRPNL